MQDALHLSRQQVQELMALRRVFLPKMGQLLRDRQRISRALQDSQVCRPAFFTLIVILHGNCATQDPGCESVGKGRKGAKYHALCMSVCMGFVSCWQILSSHHK